MGWCLPVLLCMQHRSWLLRGSAPAAELACKQEITTPNLSGLHALQVFAVAMPRRPLFPGTTFPVSIRDAKLIEEIEQIQRSG